MGRIEFPFFPNWQPLELVVSDEDRREDFMFIGTFVAFDVRIELYKHRLSRRYLNVDSAGDCYSYSCSANNNPYTIISREDALARVFHTAHAKKVQ